MKNKAYILPDGTYLETHYAGDEPPTNADGRVECPHRPSLFYDWDGTAWVENAQRVADAVMTPAKLDALADAVTANEFEINRRTKAIGRVMGDLAALLLSVPKSEANAEIKSRFRGYYRELLDE